VLKGTGVPIPLGKSKINAVDEISAAASSIGDEVSRFDITMDKVAGVHELHSLQHLISNHKDGFEGETTTTFVELILKRWSEEIHNHQIVRILGAKIVNFCKSGSILKLTVNLIFVTQLGTAGTMLLKLHSNLNNGEGGRERISICRVWVL